MPTCLFGGGSFGQPPAEGPDRRGAFSDTQRGNRHAVVIEEKKATDRFLGDSCFSRQIRIRGDTRAGRTEAQRNTMMLRMVQEVAQITAVKEDDSWVYLCNLAPTDLVERGHVLPQPGEEAAWFDHLPKPF